MRGETWEKVVWATLYPPFPNLQIYNMKIKKCTVRFRDLKSFRHWNFSGNINHRYAQLVPENVFAHYVYHISHGIQIMSEWVILLSAK